MKLTKGALTMLLAQYRAIYKNAFIKGLASAALATAVLASGSASADPAGTTLDAALKKDVPVTGDFNFADNTTIDTADSNTSATVTSKGVKVTGTVGTSITVGKEQHLTLDLGTATNKGSLVGKEDGSSKLIIGGADTAGQLTLKNLIADLTKFKVEIGSAADHLGKINVAAGSDVTINKATVDSLAKNGKNAVKGNIVIDGGHLNYAGDDVLALDSFAETVGTNAGLAVGTNGGKLTANKVSITGVDLKAKIKDNKLDVETKELQITTAAASGATSGAKSIRVSDSVVVSEGTISGTKSAIIEEKNLILDRNGAEGAGTIALGTGATASKIDLKGKVLVEQGAWNTETDLAVGTTGTIIIGSEKQDQTASLTGKNLALSITDADGVALEIKKDNSLTLTGDTGLTVTKGTANIAGSLTANKVTLGDATNSGSLVLTGILNSGNVKIDEKGTLTVKGEKAQLDLANTDLTLNGTLAIDGANANLATVKSLTVADGKGSVTVKNGKVQVDVSKLGASGNKINSATAQSGGILELTDETGTSLADFTGAHDSIASSSKTLNLAAGGTIKGANLTLNGGNNNIEIELADKTSGLDFESALFTADKTKKTTLKKGTLTLSNSLTVKEGSDLSDFTVGATSNEAILNLKGNGTLNITALNLDEGATVNVDGSWLSTGKLESKNDNTIKFANKESSLSFNQLTTTAGKVLTLDGGKLSIVGIEDTVDNDGKVTSGSGDIALAGNVKLNNNATLSIGKDALSDVITKTEKDGVINYTLADGIKGKINTTDATSTLHLAFGKDVSLDGAALKDFRDKLGTGFTGFVNVGDAQFGGEFKKNDNGRYDWSNVKDYAKTQFTNNQLDKAAIEVKSAETTDGVMGSFGAIYVNGVNNLTVNGATNLKDANANGGFFVSKKDASGNVVAGDITVKDNANITLANGGSIGTVTLKNGNKFLVDGNGVTNITAINGKTAEVVFNGGKVNVTKDTSADSLTVKGSDVTVANVKANDVTFENGSKVTSNDITANEVNLDKGSNLTANNIVINASTAKDSSNISTILDKSTLNAKSIKVGENSELFVGDSSVSVESLTSDLGKDATVFVGSVLPTENATEVDKKKGNQSANLFVKDASKFNGTVNVAGGAEKASMAVFATTSADEKAVFDIKHTARVGENAVLGYGFDSQEALVDVLNQVKGLTASGQVEDKTSVAAFNKQATVNGNVTLGEEFTPAQSVAARDAAPAPTTPTVTAKGTLNLGKGSALLLTDKAFGENKTGVAITADKVNVQYQSVDGTTKDFLADATLVGNFTARDKNLQLFNSNNIKDLAGFEVYAGSGLLVGKLGENGTVAEFKRNPDYDANVSFYNASQPVRTYIENMLLAEVKSVMDDVKAPEKPKNDKDTAAMAKYEKDLAAYEKAQKAHEKQMSFIGNLAGQLDGGKGFEQSARFAVYGGSVKAAELASKAGTDAIKAYISGTANVATAQTATGSIFVVPTYKSSDSDSFNAEGVDFGSDIKLSGVALGADFTVAPNVKVGAMFNVGTGDADGKGVASGIETDLDYVGGGLFASYTQDALSITADLTYTQSSADMKATIADNKVSADVDTTVLSLGVQGAYKFDLDGSYATPYAGIRYSKYDIDDYTLSAKGMEYMTNSFDSMTVFSIPLGVELGTQMTAGSWTVEPSLDLGVTFNLGDTDLTHSARAVALVDGMNLTSEVLDDVVFGVKGALKANYNGLSLGLGLGYEVGSNADDLSVQATGIYTF